MLFSSLLPTEPPTMGPRSATCLPSAIASSPISSSLGQRLRVSGQDPYYATIFGVMLPYLGLCYHIWGHATIFGVVLPYLGLCYHVWGYATIFGVMLPYLGLCYHIWGCFWNAIPSVFSFDQLGCHGICWEGFLAQGMLR